MPAANMLVPLPSSRAVPAHTAEPARAHADTPFAELSAAPTCRCERRTPLTTEQLGRPLRRRERCTADGEP
jgi:hypothetical protein